MVTTFRLEMRCANTGMSSYHNETKDMLANGFKCFPPSSKQGESTCCMQKAFLEHDLRPLVWDIMNSSTTLRQVMVMWGRCFLNVPTRVVGIDLDNMPHSIDRPGDESDRWEKRDKDW